MSLRKVQQLQLTVSVSNLGHNVTLMRHSLTFWQMNHAFVVDI